MFRNLASSMRPAVPALLRGVESKAGDSRVWLRVALVWPDASRAFGSPGERPSARGAGQPPATTEAGARPVVPAAQPPDEIDVDGGSLAEPVERKSAPAFIPKGKAVDVSQSVAHRRKDGYPVGPRLLRTTGCNHPTLPFEAVGKTFTRPGGAPLPQAVEQVFRAVSVMSPQERLRQFSPLERRLVESARQSHPALPESGGQSIAEGSLVLDVGAGAGRHAFLLRRERFEVDVVEPDPQLAAALRRQSQAARLGIRVHEGGDGRALSGLQLDHARMDRVAPYLSPQALASWLVSLHGGLADRAGTLFLSTYHEAQWWNQLAPAASVMNLSTLVDLAALAQECGFVLEGVNVQVQAGHEDEARHRLHVRDHTVWAAQGAAIEVRAVDDQALAMAQEAEDRPGTVGAQVVLEVLLRAR